MLWNYKTYSCAGDIFTNLVDSTVSMIKFTAFRSLTRKKDRKPKSQKCNKFKLYFSNHLCDQIWLFHHHNKIFKKWTGASKIKVLLRTIHNKSFMTTSIRYWQHFHLLINHNESYMMYVWKLVVKEHLRNTNLSNHTQRWHTIVHYNDQWQHKTSFLLFEHSQKKINRSVSR